MNVNPNHSKVPVVSNARQLSQSANDSDRRVTRSGRYQLFPAAGATNSASGISKRMLKGNSETDFGTHSKRTIDDCNSSLGSDPSSMSHKTRTRVTNAACESLNPASAIHPAWFDPNQKTLYFSNGDEYEGDHVNGKPHGAGTYIFADGNRYIGNFFEGRQTGKGTFIWSNGNHYEGDFVDSRQTGKGTFTWPNGNKYRGDFVNGTLTGTGILTFSHNGDKYEIEVIDGKLTRKVTITYTNGTKYVGEFVHRIQPVNRANSFYTRQQYKGEVVSMRLTGYGIFIWADGRQYAGEFVDGAISGEGTYTWLNRDSFESSYLNLLPDDLITRYIMHMSGEMRLIEAYPQLKQKTYRSLIYKINETTGSISDWELPYEDLKELLKLEGIHLKYFKIDKLLGSKFSAAQILELVNLCPKITRLEMQDIVDDTLIQIIIKGLTLQIRNSIKNLITLKL